MREHRGIGNKTRNGVLKFRILPQILLFPLPKHPTLERNHKIYVCLLAVPAVRGGIYLLQGEFPNKHNEVVNFRLLVDLRFLRPR